LPGGAGPRTEQQQHERVDLPIGEMRCNAVLVAELRLNEHADEVILRRLSTSRHDRPDYVDDLLRIACERSAYVERVFDRHSEAARDRQDGYGSAEVDVEFGMPVADEAVDEQVDRLGDPVLRPPLAIRRQE